MGLRRLKREKRELREQALLRYAKEKQRNLLAEPGIKSFVIVLDNLKSGFNVPKIFRSAEAFGCYSIHLVNIEAFDPAPAKGTFRKVPAVFHENFKSCYHHLINDGYTLFALEAGNSSSLTETELPEKSAFIFGNEGLGLSFDKENYPAIQNLSIPHFGVTESLNVSVAASIVMYEYIRQYP
jgi:tRNA G18 (ribose-2'-O)-methylase SpoU